MSWSPLDCHAHSTWSDGQLDIDPFLARVRERGVRPSLADHVSRDVAGAIDSLERLDEYLDALAGRDMGRAAEFCWHDSLWREIPPATQARFTHTIGSLHAIWLPDGELQRVFTRDWPEGLTPQRYVDAMLDNLERLAAEMPVDLVAHPTLLPLSIRSAPPEEVWTDAQEARMVSTFRDAGLVFEVSSRYRPHPSLVRRMVDAGVRLSLGSDGHTADHVGDVAFPLALTRSLGVEDEALYDPAVHGRRGGRRDGRRETGDGSSAA
jgi:histidinol phosphatase-like PHP family hydrolase